MKYTLPALLDNSFANYSQNISLGFVGEESFTYSELKKEIDSLIVILEKFGIEKGDKVAILSTNMPNWGISFFALNYMGVIAVPILPDFHTKEIENIIIHAECKALFVSSNLIHKLKDIKADKLKTRILIDNFNEIEIGEDVNEVAIRFKNADYNSSPKMDHTVEESDLASIIYTSGTTGSSKGVMLTHKNIAYDAYHCESVYKVEPTDVMLSILPLSHSYENTIGLVLPIISGASVKYNKNPPTPTVLMAALKEVRPTVMLTVPLIIEKIYKGKVLPNINSKAITRTLYKFAPTRKLLNRVAGKKLYETFGGR
ncbi:MAG: AMP-binding protein, partial [Bacteroidetes bacterium]|nr:AMP-binding protein [Bacteroidota bacterium]